MQRNLLLLVMAWISSVAACSSHRARVAADASRTALAGCDAPIPMMTPLVKGIYTADLSAHVFDGRVYIYPSHDLEENPPSSNAGDHFGMKDYRVYSMPSPLCGPVVDHGEVLHVDSVPWAKKQMWAPDAAFKDGGYYLYFPAKDKDGIFRIGVAKSSSPAGPFVAEPEPIAGSFSIDPAVFVDDDGKAYMYFGGIWGGQLQDWTTGTYKPGSDLRMGDEPAIGPRVATMADDMTSFAEAPVEVMILGADGQPLAEEVVSARFFEGPWVHKHNGTYYLSYSTGQTHYIVYATSKDPKGPFTYRGRILEPVKGWTTHHSIVKHQGEWYLFYHDSSCSGRDNQRCMKVALLTHRPDGSIETIDP